MGDEVVRELIEKRGLAGAPPAVTLSAGEESNLFLVVFERAF